MTKFNEAIEKNMDQLQRFTPVVARVHGGSHPEFHDVHKLFDQIEQKVNEKEQEELKLEEEFKQLRAVTHNYTVPEDTCESYEAVYHMLAELDEAYHN